MRSVFIIGVALFVLTVVALEVARSRRHFRQQRIVLDALFEEWRQADEKYVAFMRQVLEAQRVGDYVKYQSMQSEAADLYVKAITAERRARRF